MSNEICRDIAKLVPDLQERVKKLQIDLSIHKIPIFVFETFRIKARQQKLYKQGYSRCDGIKKISAHQKGRAVDMVVKINNKWSWDARTYAKYYYTYGGFAQSKYGLVWGGVWKTITDFPHIQLRG